MAARSRTSSPRGKPPRTVTQRILGRRVRIPRFDWDSSYRRPRSTSVRKVHLSSAARFLAAINSPSGSSIVVFILVPILPIHGSPIRWWAQDLAASGSLCRGCCRAHHVAGSRPAGRLPGSTRPRAVRPGASSRSRRHVAHEETARASPAGGARVEDELVCVYDVAAQFRQCPALADDLGHLAELAAVPAPVAPILQCQTSEHSCPTASAWRNSGGITQVTRHGVRVARCR